MTDVQQNMQNDLSFRVECINPILRVSDMAVSRSFYKEMLGFTEAPWGSNEFTRFNRDQGAVYLCRGAQGNPGTWVWIGFDGDIYAWYEELKFKGVKIRMPPTNYSWALEMHVEDPDGHVLRWGTDPDPREPFMDR